MTCAELWSIIIQGLVAVATLLLAVIAIWGDWIRHRLLGPKLTINLLDNEGTLTHIKGSNLLLSLADFYCITTGTGTSVQKLLYIH